MKIRPFRISNSRADYMRRPQVAAIFLLLLAGCDEHQKARLVSVKEQTPEQRLSFICETVRSDALDILRRHPDALNNPPKMRSEVSLAESAKLQLFDYACQPKSPTVSY
jgi:hypothetical protein